MYGRVGVPILKPPGVMDGLRDPPGCGEGGLLSYERSVSIVVGYDEHTRIHTFVPSHQTAGRSIDSKECFVCHTRGRVRI